MAIEIADEDANILILLKKHGLITNENLELLLDQLDRLCRKITKFQKTLR
jgi:hypothetical protein